jgi:hypothetical protein
VDVHRLICIDVFVFVSAVGAFTYVHSTSPLSHSMLNPSCTEVNQGRLAKNGLVGLGTMRSRCVDRIYYVSLHDFTAIGSSMLEC